jgi:hypothetical protein
VVFSLFLASGTRLTQTIFLFMLKKGECFQPPTNSPDFNPL